MRTHAELPSVPLPAWIMVRINTIHSLRELKRLLRTDYVRRQAHAEWRTWAAPKPGPDAASEEAAIPGRGPIIEFPRR